MFKILTLLVVLVCVGCSGNITSESVVRVVFENGSQCTGFFIEADRVITSSHCTNSLESNVTIYYRDEHGDANEIEGELIHVKAFNNIDGFAIIDVNLDGPPIKWCKARIGNKVRSWKWTDEGLINVEGHILWRWGQKYWSNTPTTFGFSGGPVTHNGCVIGVHQGRTGIATSVAIKPTLGDIQGDSNSSTPEQPINPL